MTETTETYAKFAEYRRTGDRALRNELVEEHVRLAEFLARRFSHRGESPDDLRQVALVGLLKAVERFEPDRGLQFSSFATPTITGELKRHHACRGSLARTLPRAMRSPADELSMCQAMRPSFSQLYAPMMDAGPGVGSERSVDWTMCTPEAMPSAASTATSMLKLPVFSQG